MGRRSKPRVIIIEKSQKKSRFSVIITYYTTKLLKKYLYLTAFKPCHTRFILKNGVPFISLTSIAVEKGVFNGGKSTSLC